MNAIKLKNDWSNLEDFQNHMPEELQELWEDFTSLGDDVDYIILKNWQDLFKPHGLTFDFYLDASPFDFKLYLN